MLRPTAPRSWDTTRPPSPTRLRRAARLGSWGRAQTPAFLSSLLGLLTCWPVHRAQRGSGGARLGRRLSPRLLPQAQKEESLRNAPKPPGLIMRLLEAGL